MCLKYRVRITTFGRMRAKRLMRGCRRHGNSFIRLFVAGSLTNGRIWLYYKQFKDTAMARFVAMTVGEKQYCTCSIYHGQFWGCNFQIVALECTVGIDKSHGVRFSHIVSHIGGLGCNLCCMASSVIRLHPACLQFNNYNSNNRNSGKVMNYNNKELVWKEIPALVVQLISCPTKYLNAKGLPSGGKEGL